MPFKLEDPTAVITTATPSETTLCSQVSPLSSSAPYLSTMNNLLGLSNISDSLSVFSNDFIISVIPRFTWTESKKPDLAMVQIFPILHNLLPNSIHGIGCSSLLTVEMVAMDVKTICHFCLERRFASTAVMVSILCWSVYFGLNMLCMNRSSTSSELARQRSLMILHRCLKRVEAFCHLVLLVLLMALLTV